MQSFELLYWAVLSHFIGDYVLQSHWMATEKTKSWLPAIIHAVFYTLPFVFLTQNIWALLIIGVSHAIIDRYRLARHLIWFKNFISPRSYWCTWKQCNITGYSKEVPVWLTTWLLIITDNVIHVAINSITLLNLGA